MYFDFIILGGGVAGLSLARSLQEYGKKVMLLETHGIGYGASGAPVSLGNPATGPKAKLIWRAETCYLALTRQLDLAPVSTDKTVYQVSGVLRPALDAKQASKMKKQFDATQWPQGWAYWLDESEINNFDPGLTCVDGGVWLPVGLTIDTDAYLSILSDYLIENGLYYEISPSYTLNYEKNKWVLETYKTDSFYAQSVVNCTGYEVTQSPDWDFLPLEAIKGQLAIFNIEKPILGRHALAGGGYIARISDNRVLVGSTYEHNFEKTQSTEGGTQILKNKLLRLLPYLDNSIEFADTWSGVRVSSKDHMPIVGEHPQNTNLYIFSGLGSKGMLYSAHLADCLSEYILKGTPLPEDVDLHRFI